METIVYHHWVRGTDRISGTFEVDVGEKYRLHIIAPGGAFSRAKLCLPIKFSYPYWGVYQIYPFRSRQEMQIPE